MFICRKYKCIQNYLAILCVDRSEEEIENFVLHKVGKVNGKLRSLNQHNVPMTSTELISRKYIKNCVSRIFEEIRQIIFFRDEIDYPLFVNPNMYAKILSTTIHFEYF